MICTVLGGSGIYTRDSSELSGISEVKSVGMTPVTEMVSLRKRVSVGIGG